MNVAQIELGTSLDRDQAASLRKRLLATLVECDAAEIDGGRVRVLHPAALQVLVAFVRDMAGRGNMVWWSECSECVREVAHLCGAEQALSLDAV